LTRVSIFEKHCHSKEMDCRVKPGNDDRMGRRRGTWRCMLWVITATAGMAKWSRFDGAARPARPVI
jgi:hypothetical protein